MTYKDWNAENDVAIFRLGDVPEHDIYLQDFKPFKSPGNTFVQYQVGKNFAGENLTGNMNRENPTSYIEVEIWHSIVGLRCRNPLRLLNQLKARSIPLIVQPQLGKNFVVLTFTRDIYRGYRIQVVKNFAIGNFVWYISGPHTQYRHWFMHLIWNQWYMRYLSSTVFSSWERATMILRWPVSNWLTISKYPIGA